MIIGLSASINRALSGGSASFSPLSLFSGGKQGGWYDHSDSAIRYQDSAGQALATTDGQSFGMLLDKSGSNTDVDQSQTAWVNQTFDTFSSSGTTVTATKISAGGLQAASMTALFTPAVGNVYRANVTVNSNSISDDIQVGLFQGTNIRTNQVAINAVGTYDVYLTVQVSTSMGFGLSIAGTLSTIDVTLNSLTKVNNNLIAQATAGQREQYKTTGGFSSALSDGVDDNYLCRQAGGSTTAFAFMTCIKIGQVGVRQTLFADNGTNTGYKVELNTSNQLVLSAGNGSSFTTVTTANTFTNGQTVSIEAYDDGTNLGVCLNKGTPVTVARPTVSAGTVGFTLDKDNGASSGYCKSDNYGIVYGKNTAFTSPERANTITYLRAKGGI